MVHKTEHDHERRLNVNYFLFTTLQQQLYSTTKIRISMAQKLVKKFIILIFLFSWATAKNFGRVFVKYIKQFELHIFADLLSSSKKAIVYTSKKSFELLSLWNLSNLSRNIFNWCYMYLCVWVGGRDCKLRKLSTFVKHERSVVTCIYNASIILNVP